ncbi:uncharacterized protein LOC101854343 isoform X2 [Aplysia californica]|uniref:Uncharacterized protein LOC101854343 isoform X2 n=1 Tax=Aplysia californica TaxID=6500 RepID=A0ABM0JV40_APLCA|nr:uncharacterized protein LOC101854343 isoform X2 [Aplysia californica]
MAENTTACSPSERLSSEMAHTDKQPDADLDCFGRLGSQLDEKVEFKNRFGERISATPIIIDFLRVLQLGHVHDMNGVISGVSNRDLLHAVVALYDISLSDMDTETLYATVCSKWARTIVLVQDVKDAAMEMTERNVKKRARSKEAKSKESEQDKESNLDWSQRVDAEKDVLIEEEASVGAFTEVFSDTEEEEEDEEGEDEDEEEEDYSKGIQTFITKAIERRKNRDACDGILSPNLIGIENRLLACATFEKKFIQHKERVIHLTLISVRPRYRKYRMGRYLLSKCLSPTVVGQHEAVVVHADNSAVDFFRKFGFSDDTVLNSKWSELADAFTNCTLMSFLPGFSGHSLLYTDITRDMDPDLYDIDHELKSWQAKSKEAYQGHLCCLMRLRNEILQLKCLVKTQTDLMNKLICDSDRARKEKLLMEKEMTELRLEAVTKTFSGATGPENNADDKDEETTGLIQQLESQVEKLCKPPPSDCRTATPPKRTDQAVPTSSEIISRFIQGMEMDRSIQVRYSVTSIMKARDNPTLRAKFEGCMAAMHDPSMMTELYYCGSLEKPSRLSQVLKEGFREEDFTHGEFGRGLYFSKYPSKAAQFSDLGKLLEVKVGLGKVETVMRYDRTRKSPGENYDSIISPGRLYKPGDQGDIAMLSQEYVVFNVHQVLPLCIIYYSANPSAVL